MKVTLSVEVDKDTLERAEKKAREMGVTLDEILNEDLNRLIVEKSITIEGRTYTLDKKA